METIHQIIKRLRAAKGLTLEDVAAQVGVKWQSVQEWEAGKTAPSRKNQPKVAKALGVTVPELHSNEGMDPMAMRLNTKEELLVMHFRQMNENQQDDFVKKVRLGGAAGAVTRKAAKSKKKLKGVDDPTVARAFKSVGQLAATRRTKKRPGRPDDAPMDDYPDPEGRK